MSAQSHKHTDGKEYELKTGKLYYLVSRQEYELYFGQRQDTHGDEMEGVSVVTGAYIMADVEIDGKKKKKLTVIRVFRSDTSGAIEEHASEDILRAEIQRLSQLNHSLEGQVKSLQQQLGTQQVSVLTAPVVVDDVIDDGVDTTSIGNGFGAQLKQAVDAQERESA